MDTPITPRRARGIGPVLLLVFCAAAAIGSYAYSQKAKRDDRQRIQSTSRTNEALSDAVRSGDLKRIETALQSDRSADYGGALFAASYDGSSQVVRLLLSRAKPLYPFDLEHALYAAAGFGYAEIASLLMRAGATGNMRNPGGYTVLARASEKGHVDVVGLLLDSGVDPDSPIQPAPHAPGEFSPSRDAGMTPLMLASYNGHAAVVRELLKRGADAALRSHCGHTALELSLRGVRGRDNRSEQRSVLPPRAKRLLDDAAKKVNHPEVQRMLAGAGGAAGIEHESTGPNQGKSPNK